jgi:hypothetical protein
LETLGIQHSSEDSAGLLHFFSPGHQDFVNFREFAASVQPNIIAHNATRLNESDRHLTAMQFPPFYHGPPKPIRQTPNELDASKPSQLQKHERSKDESKLDVVKRQAPPSRYGLRPTYDSFHIVKPPKTASSYITEELRLQPKNLVPFSLAEDDKVHKAKTYQSKLDSIRGLRDRASQLASIAEESSVFIPSKRRVNKSFDSRLF